MSFRCLIFTGDRAACYKFRIEQPFNELKRYGVEYTPTPILPLFASQIDFVALRKLVREHQIVLFQRIIDYEKIKIMHDICFLEGRPFLFEVDDNYLSLEPHNPCYFSPALNNPLIEHARNLQREGNQEELDKIMPQLEEIRLAGLEGYKKSLPLFDAITVTTEELAQSIRPFNKNVHVFPNQMERTWWIRDYELEQCDEKGKMLKINLLGMRNVPSIAMERDPKTFEPVIKEGAPVFYRICRVGYSGTSSHYADFCTITESWNKLAEKWADKTHFVYIGDPWFWHQQRHFTGPHKPVHDEGCIGAQVGQLCGCGYNPTGDNKPIRRIHIEETAPDLYHINLRNLDIGISPLEKTVFNMGKSDLKAMEYASWGAVPVIPNYITYSRFWTHGVNCMMYSNEEEFYKCIEYLFTHPAEREMIGRQAREYVENHRLEKHHAPRRYEFYKNIIENNKVPAVITPNKVKNENSK